MSEERVSTADVSAEALEERFRGDSVTGVVALGFALAGGQVAWMVHLTVGMGLVGTACGSDALWVIHALTVVTALVAGAAVATGIGVLRRAADADGSGWEVRGREWFMALLGVLLSGAGLLLILFEGLPVFVVDPCGS